MSILVKDIPLDLKRRFKVDEYFYPTISMDIDIPNGLVGEVTEIGKVLKRNGFRVTTENVFRVMELKKSLLMRYDETVERKKSKAKYRKMILEDIKPTGITLPIDLLFVNGIMILLLYVAARFVGSFADEAGKIAARKLLDDEKKLSKEHNVTIKEYKFLKNKAVILIEKGNGLGFLIKNLQREGQE